MSLTKLLQRVVLGVGLTASACGGEMPADQVMEEPKRMYTCESASRMILDNCFPGEEYHCEECESEIMSHLQNTCNFPTHKQDPSTPPELINFNLYTYCTENVCGVRANDDYFEEAERRFPGCVPQDQEDCYFIFLLNITQGTTCE